VDFGPTEEARQRSILNKLEINKTNKVKINSLKIAKDLGIIAKEEFKSNVKEILNL